MVGDQLDAVFHDDPTDRVRCRCRCQTRRDRLQRLCLRPCGMCGMRAGTGPAVICDLDGKKPCRDQRDGKKRLQRRDAEPCRRADHAPRPAADITLAVSAMTKPATVTTTAPNRNASQNSNGIGK